MKMPESLQKLWNKVVKACTGCFGGKNNGYSEVDEPRINQDEKPHKPIAEPIADPMLANPDDKKAKKVNIPLYEMDPEDHERIDRQNARIMELENSKGSLTAGDQHLINRGRTKTVTWAKQIATEIDDPKKQNQGIRGA